MTLDNIDVFVFDFDGVLTNNLVNINQSGEESVVCSRSDGLAFDVLRKIKYRKNVVKLIFTEICLLFLFDFDNRFNVFNFLRFCGRTIQIGSIRYT